MYCPIDFILLTVIVNAEEKVAFEIVSIGPSSSFILWATEVTKLIAALSRTTAVAGIPVDINSPVVAPDIPSIMTEFQFISSSFLPDIN